MYYSQKHYFPVSLKRHSSGVAQPRPTKVRDPNSRSVGHFDATAQLVVTQLATFYLFEPYAVHANPSFRVMATGSPPQSSEP